MTFKLQLREERPATIAEHRALRDEIARLKEQLGREWPAIEELTKERDDYKMRWLGSMSPEDAALIRAENERLRWLITLGDFTNLRPNSDSFKLVQQIRREQSTGEQASHTETRQEKNEREMAEGTRCDGRCKEDGSCSC